MFEDFIPKMHGSWCVWLASAVLGVGLAGSISFPVIASAIFLLFISPISYTALTPYAFIFLLLGAVRNNLKIYAAIMVPWMLLTLLTLWAVALAEDALFSKKIRYSPFSLAAFVIAAPITKLKTKHLGLSLLGTELYFAALTTMTFRA